MLTKEIDEGVRLEKAATDAKWACENGPAGYEVGPLTEQSGEMRIDWSQEVACFESGCDAELSCYLRNNAHDFLTTARRVNELQDDIRNLVKKLEKVLNQRDGYKKQLADQVHRKRIGHDIMARREAGLREALEKVRQKMGNLASFCDDDFEECEDVIDKALAATGEVV